MKYHGITVPSKRRRLANRLVLATFMLTAYGISMFLLFGGSK